MSVEFTAPCMYVSGLGSSTLESERVTFPELFSNPVNLVHGSQGHHASPQSGQRLPYVFSGVRNEGPHLVEVESVLRLLGRRRHELIDLR